ncbi:MAG: RagB/SusD family nutrient uptake outer membrane protein [Tidjanibacter sp.]|nr:RagB/SusD family nutrient uptake outer membrane protein [Tidjanibacter sp.]
MKKVRIIIAALTLTAVASSCNYLDVEVSNVVLEEEYYQNATQCQEALDGVYAILNESSLYGNNMLGRMGLSADIGYEYYKSDQSGVGYYKTTVTDAKVFNYWSKCYVGIARANSLLANIDNIIEDKEYNRIKGEALFLRGYYYYMLAKRFGGVPLVLKPIEDISSQEKYADHSTLEQVYVQIVKDMEAAIDLVDKTEVSSEGWQVTKTTVWGMLARVCLNMAGQPLCRIDMYEKAAGYAKKVVDSGVHSLNPSFEQIFINYAQNIYDIRESMWEVNFWGDGTGLYATSGMVGRNIGVASDQESPIGFCGGYLRVNPKLYYLYDESDKRRDWTINNFTYTKDGTKNYMTSLGRLSDRYCAKFRREYELPSSTKQPSATEINFPLLRYSDVLLMYAECYAYAPQSADATLAYEYFNMVRRRGHGVDIYTPSEYDFTDQSITALQLEIQNERARELAYEMLRKDDLCRWGILYTEMIDAGSYITGSDTMAERAAITAYTSVRSRDELWPIPGRELSTNSKLTQNPGW